MISDYLSSSLLIEVICASPESFINTAAVRGIKLKSIEKINSCTLRFKIPSGDLKIIENICLKLGAEYKTVKSSGPLSYKKKLRSRLSLPAALALMLLILYASSLFVWDIELVSENPLPESRILNALSKEGLYCGACRLKISPEKLRAEILSDFPEINWLALNINGSRARVLIRLKEQEPEIYNEKQYCNVIASRSGLIKDMEVLNGIPLAYPGKAVEKGEILISGDMPGLNGSSRKVHALGRVRAETLEEYEAVTPLSCLRRGKKIKRQVKFAIKFGNKRQNLYFNSGKHIDGCVKIIKEYKLGKNGLFSLPLSIIKEELSFYELKEGPGMSELQLRENLSKRATGLNVLQSDFSSYEQEGLLRAKLQLRTLREIGQSLYP